MPFKNVDEYIASFPPEVQAILQKIRTTIREEVPEAKEKISYGIPTFTMDGNLIHYAAFKQHIGIYPPVRGDEKLQAALERYRGEKGNLRLPLDEPIPYELIKRIVKSRLREHTERASAKKGRK
jgi:uncharacterized protein YdhG (YjbR/CyaY superfamily)